MLGRVRVVVEAERAEAERVGEADRAVEAEVKGEDTVKDSELSVDGAEDRDDGEDSSNAMETGIVMWHFGTGCLSCQSRVALTY